MQLGNKIVAEKNGSFVSTLSQENKLESALTFYASFADPVKELYSWNRSFPNSREYFSTDNLAFYFGYASELLFLASRNPNQNFLVAPMPQINNSPFKLSGARVTGIAISSFSKNFNTAFIAASQMATGDFAKKFAETQGIAPVRRDLLATPPEDAFSPIFYSSALYARSWPDPSNQDTDSIFRVMVESVLSNNMTPRSALQDASSKMDLLLRR